MFVTYIFLFFLKCDDIDDTVEKAGMQKEIFVKNLYTAKEQTQAILVLLFGMTIVTYIFT